ncbi:MAG: DNA-directed RNA polymerase subunit K [Nanoarchaeota archaeon]|nr:DNA-directed RNA polymerase subunit K [Nanoarchaeota archaeon]
MTDIKKEDFTKYEQARVLGARSLQIAMDAPLLKDIPKKELEEINYDPMKISQTELNGDVLPISVKQPMPKKKAVKIKKTKIIVVKDINIVEKEKTEEKAITEDGEIMELATPEDEEESVEEKSAQ